MNASLFLKLKIVYMYCAFGLWKYVKTVQWNFCQL